MMLCYLERDISYKMEDEAGRPVRRGREGREETLPLAIS
jgi:hypothetical protein